MTDDNKELTPSSGAPEETKVSPEENTPQAAASEPEASAEAASADSPEAAKAAREAARAARALERANAAAAAEPAAPVEPSPHQPLLDRTLSILREALGNDAVTESRINVVDSHRPYLVIAAEHWPAAAVVLRDNEKLRMDYLRSLAAVDYEEHMEVGYYLISLNSKQELCIKVKTGREMPSIPSIATVWPTANWSEREIYDLFGIDFPGHPDLRRILMPDDWVGHPLRKDYEPLDPEV